MHAGGLPKGGDGGVSIDALEEVGGEAEGVHTRPLKWSRGDGGIINSWK